MYDVKKAIEDLVYYGEEMLGLDPLDATYARNRLLELFGEDDRAEASETLLDLQSEILNPMLAYAFEKGIAKPEDLIRFETKIMGYVTPAPSIVKENFQLLYSEVSPEEATDYLKDISVDSNYVRMEDVKKNIRWETEKKNGKIVVTVNLSKPEKSKEQVERERTTPAQKYPKCMLCLENVGYQGSVRHPARQTLRCVPLTLNNENWYMQMSPYVYYDNHVIVFRAEHSPMFISDATFQRLTDFVRQFPHYFLGSNADLPIVGGSILSHDHYQGGAKVLPMLERPFRSVFYKKGGVEIGIVDWYNSVVRIESKSQEKAVEFASLFLKAWRAYTDASVGIFAETDKTPHNTITPIAMMNNGKFSLNLILRNNRTDEAHPDGIYHPTRDMHHIKKEGIGLIEAMGIFILPGRLDSEIKGIVDILVGKTPYDEASLSDPENPLCKHKAMIDQLKQQTYACENCAKKAVTEYINDTCEKILNCTAVFKNDEEGQNAFRRFLSSVLD